MKNCSSKHDVELEHKSCQEMHVIDLSEKNLDNYCKNNLIQFACLHKWIKNRKNWYRIDNLQNIELAILLWRSVKERTQSKSQTIENSRDLDNL